MPAVHAWAFVVDFRLLAGYAGTMALRNGFTLIELLMVIAIIGVLVSMLLPTIRMVHELALGTRCATNLGQIGLAAATYSSEWDGMVVPGGWTHGVTPRFWYDALAQHLDEQAVVSIPSRGLVLRGCPKWQKGSYYAGLASGSWQWQQYSGYTMTLFLQNQGRLGVPPYAWGCTNIDQTWGNATFDNPLARVGRISERPFIFDSAQSSVDYIGWTSSSAACKASLERHNGKGNVLYFDNHVGRDGWSGVNLGQQLP